MNAADLAPSTEDIGAKVNAWVSVVRRARLHPTTKYVALMMASYADKDGRDIYPGVPLLTVQTGLGYRTIQRELARLRNVGLVEQLPRAGLKRGFSIPYRLIFAVDLLDNIEVLSPGAEKLAVDNVARGRRGKHRKTPTSRHLGDVTSGSTSRHSDGVQSADLAPWDAPTSRHDQLAEQGKGGITLHVPPHGLNPPSMKLGVRDLGNCLAREDQADEPDISITTQPHRPHGLTDEQWADIAWLAGRSAELTELHRGKTS